MARPPIVGVPALDSWPGPPSSGSAGRPRADRASRSRPWCRGATARAATAAAMSSAITSEPRPTAAAPHGRRRGRRTERRCSPVVWVVSWPLPAITTTSPAPAARRRARSPAPVGLDDEPAPSALPLTISAMIVAGSSLPRVVRRHDDELGAGGRGLAHRRPLGAVAVAAGAEHHEDRDVRRPPPWPPPAPARGRRACGRSRRRH